MKTSVAICTYNGERYIAEQLESILNQTSKPDEIVLSDDNSTDETLKISHGLLDDCGISTIFLEHKTHQGILRNFQNAFDACTNEIIFSCDQDDIWMPDKIERFLPFFERGCCFVYANAVVIDSKRQVVAQDFWGTFNITFDKLSIEQFRKITLTNSVVAGCNMAFTKALYDWVKPIPYHYIHDNWLALWSSWFGEVGFINKPLIEYRRHGKNVSGFSYDGEAKKEDIYKQRSRIGSSIHLYRTVKPDTWFGNAHMYFATGVLLQRETPKKDPALLSMTEDFHSFRESMLKMLPKKRVKSIIVLSKEMIKGRYRKFRGNGKKFVKDVVYLLLNKNTTFEYNMDSW